MREHNYDQTLGSFTLTDLQFNVSKCWQTSDFVVTVFAPTDTLELVNRPIPLFTTVF